MAFVFVGARCTVDATSALQVGKKGESGVDEAFIEKTKLSQTLLVSPRQ